MKYPKDESSTLEFKVAIPDNGQIIKSVIGFEKTPAQISLTLV